MKQKTMRPITWLLTFCLVLSLFAGVILPKAAAASAYDENSLQAALNSSINTTITLTSDIELTQTLVINSNATITLESSGSKKTISPGPGWNSSCGNLMEIRGGGIVNIKNIEFDAKGKCRNISIEHEAKSTLNLDGCVIKNGSVYGGAHGAGLSALNGNTVNIGGDTQFIGNTAESTSPCSGGAIYAALANVTIDKAIFENNSAHSGGAIYVYGSVVTCTENTKFISNHADQRGGAIHSHGTVVLDGTVISGQSSGQYGGAIYVSGSLASLTGTVVLKDASITGNTASANGGGIYLASETELYITGDTKVTGNNNAENKDNIYISSGATLYNAKIGSGAQIGVSTSNPTKHKVLVHSIGDAKTLGSVSLPAHNMKDSTSDYAKFTYDAELWKLQKDTSDGNTMWLDYNYEYIGGGGGSYVIFDYNLPGNPATTSSVSAGATVNIPALSNMTVGAVTYIFKGWYTAATGGSKLTGSTVTATSGLTVYYAQWDMDISGGAAGTPVSGDMYLVYFDQNYSGGGFTTAYITAGHFSFQVSFQVTNPEGGTETRTDTVSVSIPFSFPGDPYRTGYSFKGWALSATGPTTINKASWAPSQSVSTLYALWEPNSYSITWNANGGSGGTTTTQAHDTTVNPPPNTPTRNGYTFNGWYADSKCTVPLTSGTIVTGATTYYAGWTPNEHTITWDTNYTGGSVATVQQKYGESLVIQPDPVRSGYAFGGWWTQTGGRGTNAASYGTVDGNITFYAYWVTDVMPYTVTVEWADESDNDAVRPDIITVELLRNGLSTGLSYTFNSASHSGDVWAYTFANLPVADAVSNNYVYSVAVTSSVSSEYTYAADFSSNAYAGYILLTHELIVRDVNVYITWNDQSDNDGYRPASVDVQLCANGTPIVDAEAKITLPGTGDTWTYTFPSVQKYYGGGFEVAYTIEVTPTGAGELDKYSVAYNNLTATLTHAVDAVSKTVITEWNDNNDQDGKRPASMSVQLFANNQPVQGRFVTLSPANGWSYTWNDLPKYSDGGIPIVYSAYTTSTLVDYIAASTEMTIEMTYAPSSTSISAFITWSDSNDTDGLRPDFVIAELVADGVPTGDRQQLSSTNNWRTSWTNYPIYNGGQRIEYTFVVSPLPPEYSAEYIGVYDSSGLSAILTHDRLRDNFTARIAWNDGGNLSGARMGLVRVMLYADGSPIDGTVATLTEATGWEYTYSGYPVYRDGGQLIKYSIGLDSSIGYYTAAIDGMTLTLSLMPTTVDIPLNIIWDDDNNAMGIRPSYVAVTLRIGGIPSSYVAAALASNSWRVVFENFAEYKTGSVGEKIKYDAVVSVPDGYSVLYIGTTAILTTKTAQADYYATVTWRDNGNQFGQRPQRATLTLYADYSDGNGTVPTGKVRSVYAADDWVCTFEDLPAYVSGKEIIYSVVISGDINNYTPSYDGMDVYMRHNSITEDSYTTGYTARIVWQDNHNALNSRSPVVITLLANDAPYESYTMSGSDIAADTWTHAFTNLPIKLNGEPVIYTIDVSRPEHYKATATGDSISLTHVQDIEITARWADCNNDDGVRPSGLTLFLLADGIETGQSVNITGDPGAAAWSATFADVPVWSSVDTTKDISYTYKIDSSDASSLLGAGYSVNYNGFVLGSSSAAGSKLFYTMNLTRDAELADYAASIIWEDDYDRDGLRPVSLAVSLLADGAPTGITAAITGSCDAGTWSHLFENLPVYRSQGVRIIYTIAIQGNAPGGYSMIASATAPNLTLTHVPAKTNATACVTWDDSSDVAGLIRQELFVELTIDGVGTGQFIKLSQANGWSYTWSDLYAYHNHGTAYRYSFSISDQSLALLPDGYVVDISGMDCTIKHVTFSVSGVVKDTAAYFVSGASVTIYNASNSAVASATTDSNGAWSVQGLPNGSYTARATFIASSNLAGSTAVTVDRNDVADLLITLDGNASVDDDLYTYSVTGHIIDSNGKPASGALVYVWDSNMNLIGSAVADADGRYSLSDLANGTYQISVIYRHEGADYSATSNTFTIYNANIIVPNVMVAVPGPAEPDPAPCVVSGLVLDEHDVPLSGVLVVLSDSADNTYYAATGTDGIYTIIGVADGLYTVQFHYAGTAVKTTYITIAGQPAFVIETVNIDTSHQTGYGTVSGTVKDAAGKPVEGAEVYVYNCNGELVAFLVTGADGKYEFTLPVGEYVIVIKRPFDNTFSDGIVIDDGAVENGTGVPGIIVTPDCFTISGYVLDDEDHPVEGASVYLYLQDGEGNAGELISQTQSDTDGYYAFTGIQAGRYIVRIIPRYGVVIDADVAVEPNSPNGTEDDNPQVSTDSYTVSGIVLDVNDDPVKGAVVTLTDLEDNVVGTQITCDDGKYEFSNITEGEYIITITYPDKEELGELEVDVPDSGSTPDPNPNPPPGSGSGGGGGGSAPGGNIGGGRDDEQGVWHKSYINGYEDGMFKPANPISRAEVVAIVSRISEAFDPQAHYAISMADVPTGAWYASGLGFCLDAGIITGYLDGTFRPGNSITRAEFAAIVARMLKLDNAGSTSFSDTHGSWAEGYVAQLVSRNIITGYDDNTFKPDASITRAEAVTMLNRAIGRIPQTDNLDALVANGDAASFSDVPQPYWAYYQVLEAANDHWHK